MARITAPRVIFTLADTVWVGGILVGSVLRPTRAEPLWAFIPVGSIRAAATATKRADLLPAIQAAHFRLAADKRARMETTS